MQNVQLPTRKNKRPHGKCATSLFVSSRRLPTESMPTVRMRILPRPVPSFGWQILASCEIQAAAVELATADAQSVSRTSETTVAMATGRLLRRAAVRPLFGACGCFSS